MSSISSKSRFLGVDFRELWREVRRAWQGAHQWPVFAWLTPAAPVRLLQADGAESLWIGDVEQLRGASSRHTQFFALELPEHNVLRRQLTVPVMGEADTSSAIALEARSVSPFAAQDLAWGYRAEAPRDDARGVNLVLASRKQVGAYIAAQSTRLNGVLTPEIWVRSAEGAPIVLSGYGDNLRTAFAQRWRRVGYGLLVLFALLCVSIAITPTAQLRLRAIEAARSYDALAQRTAPLAKQREALLGSVEQMDALAEALADRIEPLRILNQLTKVLPDDTSIQSFKLQGVKLTIGGLTANASTLMQLLGEQPGLREVRAPSAATRVSGALKESYVIEVTLDPQFYGVVSAAEPQVSAKPPGAPLVKPEGSAASASAAVTSPTDASMSGVTSGASFGGRPATPAPKRVANPASETGSTVSVPTVKPAP